jgi:hypothetical protein
MKKILLPSLLACFSASSFATTAVINLEYPGKPVNAGDELKIFVGAVGTDTCNFLLSIDPAGPATPQGVNFWGYLKNGVPTPVPVHFMRSGSYTVKVEGFPEMVKQLDGTTKMEVPACEGKPQLVVKVTGRELHKPANGIVISPDVLSVPESRTPKVIDVGATSGPKGSLQSIATDKKGYFPGEKIGATVTYAKPCAFALKLKGDRVAERNYGYVYSSSASVSLDSLAGVFGAIGVGAWTLRGEPLKVPVKDASGAELPLCTNALETGFSVMPRPDKLLK